jgi:hypothetical protein
VPTIAGIMPNSSNDCQLADPKFQKKLPRDIENLNGEERKRSKRTRRWGSSEELLSKDQASHKDVSHGRATRAALLLPEPPSFDATFLWNTCVNQKY